MDTSALRVLDPVIDVLKPWLPRVLGALAIAVAAWLVARLVRTALLKLAEKTKLEERAHSPGLALQLAGAASALVWLLALPALLGSLDMQVLLTPVNALVTKLLAFIPNLLGAAVVVGIGFLVANIAGQLVSGALKAAGSERAAEKMGLANSLGKDGLGGLVGRLVFALLLLPTLIAAMQPLGLDMLSKPLANLLEAFLGFIPKVLSGAVIIALAVILGRTLASIARALLAGMGLDKWLAQVNGGKGSVGGRSLSELAGTGVITTFVFLGLAQAAQILGLPVLTDAISQAGAALVRMSVAAALALGGWLLANAAGRAILATGKPKASGQVILAKVAILGFTGALALRQAGLPAEIVAIAFGAVAGGAAIAVAMAFGLGGQATAAKALRQWADEPPATDTPAQPAQAPTSAQPLRSEAAKAPSPDSGAGAAGH